MLKITTVTDAQSTTLRLEGRLAGPWVEELQRCWVSTVSAKTRHPFSVDLSAVTYVDAEGKRSRRVSEVARVSSVRVLQKRVSDENHDDTEAN